MTFRSELQKRTIRTRDEGPTDGAQRNARIAAMAAAKRAASKSNKERQIASRTADAEKRTKEVMKMSQEETVTEAKHIFHVHLHPIDTRLGKMVDDKTAEPIGNKPKGDRVKLTIPATDTRSARDKATRYAAKNFGVDNVKSIEYKGLHTEETVTEAKMIKKFVFDKPYQPLVKAYSNHDTDHLKDMHKRWSESHQKNMKGSMDPNTGEKLLAVDYVLKSRGEDMKMPEHKNLGMHTYNMQEETNTEKRMKIKNVPRMDDAAPTSEKSTLGKTGSIKKIIEEKPTMSMPNFGLSASLIAAARQIVEKKDDVKLTGGKTQVEVDPETDDRSEDTDPKTDKEKKLAALAPPNDKITRKDVLVGRGVLNKEEVEQLDEGPFTGIGKMLMKRKLKNRMNAAGEKALRFRDSPNPPKENPKDPKGMGTYWDAMDTSARNEKALKRLNREEVDLDERENSPYEKASDTALDKQYGYGTSFDKTPKTSFGRAANRSSAAYALRTLRKNPNTDTETGSDAVHQGWAKTATTSADQTPEKKARRAALASTPYSKLPDDEQEKDRVAFNAIKKVFNKEDEQLDELSKKTLARYVRAASDDAATKAYYTGKTGDLDTAAKVSKRIRGIQKATNLITQGDFSADELARIDEIAQAIFEIGTDGLDPNKKYAKGDVTNAVLSDEKKPEMDDQHKHPMQQLEKIAHSIEGREPHFEHKDGSKTKVGKSLARQLKSVHDSMKTTQEKNKFADSIHASRDSMRAAADKHL